MQKHPLFSQLPAFLPVSKWRGEKQGSIEILKCAHSMHLSKIIWTYILNKFVQNGLFSVSSIAIGAVQ